MAGAVVEHPRAQDAREIRLMQIALMVLSEKVYHWATLLLVAGAFAWVLLRPDPYRIGAAVAFTLLTHVPLWWKELRAQKFAAKRETANGGQ